MKQVNEKTFNKVVENFIKCGNFAEGEEKMFIAYCSENPHAITEVIDMMDYPSNLLLKLKYSPKRDRIKIQRRAAILAIKKDSQCAGLLWGPVASKFSVLKYMQPEDYQGLKEPQKTKRITKKVLLESPSMFRFIPESMKSDVKLAISIMQDYPSIYNDLPEDLRKNPEIASLKVKDKGSNLKNLPEEMKDNKDVVLAAVSQDGNAYIYASPRLKLDEDILKRAIISGGRHIMDEIPEGLSGELLMQLKKINIKRSIDLLQKCSELVTDDGFCDYYDLQDSQDIREAILSMMRGTKGLF